MKYSDIQKNDKFFQFLLNEVKKKDKNFTFDQGFIYYNNDKIGLLYSNDNNISVDVANTFLNLGKYTNFDLSLFLNGYNFIDTYNFILINTNNHGLIRIAGNYYEQTSNELIKSNRQNIVDDFGRSILKIIPKYKKFTIVPNNIEYRKEINGMYNSYSKFEHIPSLVPGKFPWIKTLMNHIFGDQIDIGYKYMKLLYEFPKKKTYSLVLVSDDRQTGKSTFVDFLERLFKDNMVVINPQDIESSFNVSYADKNIIAIEESKFDKTQTIEKLKALATLNKITVNAKHINPYTLPFFGKFIITSNDETKFMRVDSKEIRYWIRKIPDIEGKKNPNILNDMEKEIPYFLRYLLDLPDLDFTKDRFVFTPDEVKTDLLEMTKKESKSWLYKEILENLSEFLDSKPNIDIMQFTLTDVKDRFFHFDNKASLHFIKITLKEMGLKVVKNSSYYKFGQPNDPGSGRYFEMTRDQVKDLITEN